MIDVKKITAAIVPLFLVLGLFPTIPAQATEEVQPLTTQERIDQVEPNDAVDESQAGAAYVEDEVIVSFKDSVDESTKAEVIEDAACVTPVTETATVETLTEDTNVVPIEEGASVAQAVEELSQDPAVEYVQPNYLYTLLEDSSESEAETQATTNDPWKDGTAGWNIADMNLATAWNSSRCEHTTAVAVLDTGIDTDHPDLVNNIVAATCTTDETDLSPEDVQTHGTHVAGIISAEANNGIGVAGASYNADIVSVRVFKQNNKATTGSIVRGYQYVLDHAAEFNIRVINLSLGAVGTLSPSDTTDALLLKSFKNADDAGILTICASGNVGTGTSTSAPFECWPGNCDPVLKQMYPELTDDTIITVGNINSSDTRESKSNYGPTLDLVAPGKEIYSTIPDGSYGSKDGTSMAAPAVAGCAALCFAACPEATVGDVRTALEQTAVDLGATGRDDEYGYGKVNPTDAISELTGQPPIVDFDSATVSGINSSYAFTGTALTPAPTVVFDGKTLAADTDYTVSYADNTLPGTATVTITGIGTYTGTITKTFTINSPQLTYSAHVQREGWQDPVGNGQVIGTTGKSLRMEAFRIALSGLGTDALTAQAHVQGIGWMSPVGNDQVCGTSGQSKRVEALTISLRQDLYDAGFRIYYRVHAQSIGWMGWAHDGAQSGTAAKSLRLEGIQIVLVEPGQSAPGDSFNNVTSVTTHPFVDGKLASGAITYDAMVHIQRKGNTSYPANAGSVIGTTGSSLRLEAMRLTLLNKPLSGGITYRTHVQNIGWQSWVGEGNLAGTTGRSLRLEAVSIKLNGDLASNYDVYYRTHVQNIGWTGWAMNGQDCGSAGYSYRMEAIQVIIVKKDQAAPGLNTGYFHHK